MIAYKLCRVMKDGGIASLFINRKARYEFNEWMEAKSYPTKGFKVRPYWHCTSTPNAPHLSMDGRAWFKIKMDDFHEFDRPPSQGGLWFLAKRIMLLEEVA